MFNAYQTNLNTIPGVKRPLISWVDSKADIYKDKIIFYVVLKTNEVKNNFAVSNGRETYEKCDGRILKKVWKFLGGVYDSSILKDCDVRCDEFHGVILIDRSANAERTLAKIVTEFKSLSTSLINNYRSTFGKQLWENVFKLDVVNNYTELFDIITTKWE